VRPSIANRWTCSWVGPAHMGVWNKHKLVSCWSWQKLVLLGLAQVGELLELTRVVEGVMQRVC